MVNLFWERFYNTCVKRGTKPNPVAKEIGISSGIITKWKTTGTLPNGEFLIKIADYLDCSVDYLLGRTDNPEVNSSSGEEQLHTIKIAARSGNFREITVTDSELEEMKKQIEAMEDVEDDI